MEWYLPQLKTFPDSFCSIKRLHGNDETLRKRFRLKTAKNSGQTLLLARKYRKDHDCLKERKRIMGKTRNGHAWSLYTSNKTHELASRIPELALMSQGAEELFVTLAYCRYILQPIVRVAFVYWFFVESNVNWSNRHAIKPGIKILNPKLYPPITNACAAQKTASGNVFCTDLQWGISPVLISHEEGLNSSISTSFLILRLYLRLRYSSPPPAPAGPGRNSVPYGEAPPESGTFFRLQINNSVRISLVEVYERRGKSVNSVWKRT